MSDEEEIRVAPAVLFHSFLVVAGAYIANVVFLFVIAALVFPETIKVLGSEPEEFKRIVENEPQRIFPDSMSWVLLIASAASCFLLGNLVVRFAPIGKFSHAIFFAAILFAQYLQLAIGADSGLQTKLILFMAVSPIAALLGASSSLKSQDLEA